MDEQVTFRPAEEGDGIFLRQWMRDPNIFQWFPMDGEKEIEDSARIWMDYAVKGQGITALWGGLPCGMAVIYVQPFKKLAHTCLLSILMAEGYRGHGIGTRLLNRLINLAKNTFHIEILHLEVYEGNPAQHLYERLGFTPFGEHRYFAKEAGGKYRSKIFMQKYL